MDSTLPGLGTLAVCTVVLFAKVLATASYQGYHRIGQKVFVNPEDARTFGTGTPAPAELPAVERAQAVFRNDSENIPIFLVLALIYVLVGAWPAAGPYYFWTFTLARVAHSVVYLAGLQPWRTIAYTIATTVSLLMCIHILAAV